MSYFDAHVHLMPDQAFLDAHARNVTTFFCNATGPENWQDVLDLSSRVLGVRPCVGVHPWFVGQLADDWSLQLTDILKKYPWAMVGEIGLDATKPFYEKQKAVFTQCLTLASHFQRIVHVHCVKAWPDMLNLIAPFRELKFLFHRFQGNEVIVQKLRLMNAYYSTLNAHCLDIIPENRLFVESDAPDGLASPVDIPDLVDRLNLSEERLAYNLELFLHD